MKALARPWVRLARDQRGATAMEFALVGPLFLLTMLAVFDVSWMFARNMELDSATRAASREIRTGAAYRNDDPQGLFESRLCGELVTIDCGEVLVEVSEIGTGRFAHVSPTDFTGETFASSSGIDGTGAVRVIGGFTAGSPDAVMSVRTGLQHRFMTPMLHMLWGDGDGQIQFTVTEVFRNEPFPP